MKNNAFCLFLICCLLGFVPDSLFGQQDIRLKGGYGVDARFGLEYSFEVAPGWRIKTGLESSFLSMDWSEESHKMSQVVAAPSGLPSNSVFRVNVDIDGLQEKWKLTMLNIPLMVEFNTSGKHLFYGAAGIKLGLPLSTSSHLTYNTMTTFGQSDFTNQEYRNMPDHGFSTYNNGAYDNEPDLSLSYIAALQAGMMWQLAPNMKLITGFYLDYGLNKMWNNESELFTYRASGNHQLNSIVKSYSSLSYGVELGIRVSFGKKGKRQRPTTVPTTPMEIVPVYRDSVAEQQVVTVPEEPPIPVEIIEKAEVGEIPKHYEYELLILMQPANRYDRNQTNPGRFQMDILEEKVPVLLANPSMQVLIEGYTSSDETEKEVGLKRAQAAKNHLLLRGVDASRIQVVDKGTCCPVASDANEEGRRKNRRIELHIIESE